MAVILKNKNFNKNIALDSNIINGIITDIDILSFMNKKNISYIKKEDEFYTNNVFYEMMLYYKKDNISDVINMLLKEFDIDKSFINRKISDLSSGDKKLLKYLLMLLDNKKIIVIDEPFQDLDYNNKKKIVAILKKIIRSGEKTIIVISNDSNIIYSLCKKVLLLNDKDFLYSDVSILHNKEVLDKYKIEEPLIVKFINYAKEKEVLIDYSNDIRDLIKDVYKSV